MKPIVWIGIILSVLIMIFIYINWFYKPTKKESSENFSGESEGVQVAKKLNASGWKMYGNDKCKYCRKQKEELADGFAQINYINCDTNPNECANIGGIPLWKCDDGREMNGFRTLEQLKNEA